MALPLTGPISMSQVLGEMGIRYRFSGNTWTLSNTESGSYAPVNQNSTYKPNSLSPNSMSEWRGYDHYQATSCPFLVTNVGGVSYANGKYYSPYTDMYVVDMGTTDGLVNITVNISSGSGPWAGAIGATIGYFLDDSGSATRGLPFFDTNLINTTYTVTASFDYTTQSGSKIYMVYNGIQNTNVWPKFAVTMSCPYVGGNQVTIYSKAGDTITSGDEYMLYYSQDNTNWYYVAGPLNSTSCTLHNTVSITTGTIYLKVERDSNASQVYIRGANSSTCPANLAVTCVYSVAVSSNTNVAITTAVTSGDFVDC